MILFVIAVALLVVMIYDGKIGVSLLVLESSTQIVVTAINGTSTTTASDILVPVSRLDLITAEIAADRIFQNLHFVLAKSLMLPRFAQIQRERAPFSDRGFIALSNANSSFISS